jgi:hypothetical protein
MSSFGTDGPYALAAYEPVSGATYIRFADNNIRPNDSTLRAAPATLGGNWTYGVTIIGVSYTTISNLAIQGAYAGVGINTDKNHYGGNNNTVTHCHIQHGLHRIYMQGDPTSTIPHDNEISFNSFTLNMYGYASPGAYPINPAKDPVNPSYDLALKEWFYVFLKYIVGGSNTADVAIKMGYCGKNNRIHHNIFEKGAEGVFTYLCDNPQIYSNTFQHLSDCGVLASDSFQAGHPLIPSGETVVGNWFSGVHQFVRYDRIDVADGVTTNCHYFINNAGENDPYTGMIAQFHMQGPDPADPSKTKPSTVGKFALTMAGNNFGSTGAVFHFSAHTVERQGIPAATIADNSFLSTQTIAWGGLWVGVNGYPIFTETAAMVGSFVNNRLVEDMMPRPAWYGPGNTVI